jgi:RNA polymerase sigma factor (sigma-70 family)
VRRRDESEYLIGDVAEGRAMVVNAARERAVAPVVDRRAVESESDLHKVVVAAAAGEAEAWKELVQRFGNMVVAVARSCRLNDADVAEVHQVVWLRMVENIGRIEQPDRIGAWLATTAKRESLRVVRTRGRMTLDHDGLLQRADTTTKPVDAGPIEEERALAVREAFALLPSHCRRLLSLMAGDEPMSYKEISRVLAMPIGSIGPTRGRCLEHLRKIMGELGTSA